MNVIGSDNIHRMDPATAVRNARVHARLSKRALARRAGTSPAAIVAYESGDRDPTVGTLTRLIAATGAAAAIELEARPAGPDPTTCGRRLEQVLDLAEHLPRRPPARVLAYPRFPRARER